MQRRNRSPSLVAVLVVGCALICTPAFSGENQEEQVKDPVKTAGRYQATTSSGVAVQGSFSSTATTGSSCRKGKRILATSPDFVARSSIKVLETDCHDCCAENILFKDGFESHDTSYWSSTVSG